LGDAGFRGKTALEAAIKNSGRNTALLFLAPCGPDSNPIEKSWANLKEFLRNRGSSFEDLRAAVNRHFQLDSL
jgi:transposase